MVAVSVIIPTYNRCAYVQEAIDSVLVQTYTDYEIIVIDDGSTDGTGEALKARYGDRVRYQWQVNRGESVARNRGVTLARGNYLAFLDSDDVWLPEKLERQLEQAERRPDAGLISCRFRLIDGRGAFLAPDASLANGAAQAVALPELAMGNSVGGPSAVLVCRQLFDQVGGFDPQIRYGEDWDLWLRLARVSCLWVLPDVLVYQRRHRGTQSYYPDLSRTGAVLDDHLRLLSKAFGADTAPDMLAALRRAKSKEYWRASLDAYALGQDGQARSLLRQALAYHHALASEAEYTQMLINCAALVAESEARAPYRDAVALVDKVYGDLQSLGSAVTSRRKISAAAQATLGFMAVARWGCRSARPHFGRAIRQDPHWLSNLGLVAYLAESYVGPAPLVVLRKIARAMRKGRVGSCAATFLG